MQHIAWYQFVTGLSLLKIYLSLCEGCIYDKHNKISSSKISTTYIIILLALIYFNLCDSMAIPSFGGAYFLLFLENYSYFIIYIFKSKVFLFFKLLMLHLKLISLTYNV